MQKALHAYKKNLHWTGLLLLIGITALHRGGISMQSHLLWMLALLPIFAITVWNERASLKKTARISRITIFLSGIIIVLIILSLLNSTTKSFGFFMTSSLIGGIATFWITLQWKIQPKQLNSWLTHVVLLTVGLATFGMALYARTPPDRLAGTFGKFPSLITTYPNAFALLIIIVGPIAVYNLATSKQSKTWIAINAILLSALILTFSRGSWISAIFVTVTAGVLYKKHLNTKLLQKLITAIIIGALLTTGLQQLRQNHFETNTIKNKITLRANEGASSVNERIEFWKHSLTILRQYPILGSGPDSFPFIYSQHQTKLLATSDHPHNAILKMGTEIGMPAVLILLLMLVLILRYLIMLSARLSKEKQALLGALSLSITGILLHNSIDYNLNFVPNSILLWATLGWIVSLISEKQKQTRTGVKTILITTGLIVVLLFGAASYEIFERKKIVNGRTLVTAGQSERGLKQLESAHPIFPQELSFIRAQTYESLSKQETTKRERKTWINKGTKTLEAAIEDNPTFSGYYNLLGEFHRDAPYGLQRKIAINDFQQALQLDSKNWLRYHYNLAAELKRAGYNLDDTRYKNFLKEYLNLLKVNAHNTVMTDNPQYAIKLANLIRDAELVKKITFYALLERKKMYKKFPVPLPPL